MSLRRHLIMWLVAGPVVLLIVVGILVWRRASSADQWNTFLAGDPHTERKSSNKRGASLATLKPACKRVGLPSISWHSFRHTHATLLSDLGESLSTAQTQLGQARLSTTSELYTHAVPASERAAVEKLERTIWATKLDPIGPMLEAKQKLGSTLIQ